MKSKKQLFNDMAEITSGNPNFVEIATKRLKHKKISNETYGKSSMIYITWESYEERLRMEKILMIRGHNVKQDYYPNSSYSEVQVSYFKGCHWDE